jgi:ABC-type sugar transport system permease subunit
VQLPCHFSGDGGRQRPSKQGKLALPAIMILSIWQGLGFQMVILLAGLQAIPDQLYEAASIDGAGRVGQFWHVTLPQLRNPLRSDAAAIAATACSPAYDISSKCPVC